MVLARKTTYLDDSNTHNVVGAVYFYKAYIYKALHIQIYLFLDKVYSKPKSILHSMYIQEKYLENSQIKKNRKTHQRCLF